jgi:hypothetical protein
MKLRTTAAALLALLLGVNGVASAKDPFSYFRRGATTKTVSQTNAAGKQEGVVQAAPEVVQGVPAPTPPYVSGAEVAQGEMAPQPEVDGGYGGGYGPYAPGVFSVWPGIPACCDPWLGYCQEPRCYPCAKGQGRYIYYVHPCVKHGQECGGHFITWAHGKQATGQCNCPTCGGQSAGQCSSCVSVTDANHPTPTPVPTPAPQRSPTAPRPDALWNSPSEQAPRNELPPATARANAARSGW